MASSALHAEELAQLDRILESHALRGSESLCKLLRHLTEHALAGTAQPLREYDIATQVFGRRAEFDPQSDSIVRVQMGRLRTRLAQYYAEAGERDPVIFDLPKGTYSVVFSYRERAKRDELPLEAPAPPVALQINTKSNGWVLPAVAVAAVLALAAALIWPKVEHQRHVAPAVATLWGPLFANSDAPLVVFANRAPQPASSAAADTTLQSGLGSGVGEVMGAAALARLFGSSHHDLRFRRTAITSWEDAKNSNLIFVGTAGHASSTLNSPERFIVQRERPGDETSPVVIVNMAPGPGESRVYRASFRDTCCRPAEEDYAVVMLSRGLSVDRLAVTLAGITTLGTQAAVEFVCDADSVGKLMKALGTSGGANPPYFEALIRVRIQSGVPIRSDLVAVHIRKQG